EPAEVAKTVALFREALRRHFFRTCIGALFRNGLEALVSLAETMQSLFSATGPLQHAGESKVSHRQIVIGAEISVVTRCLGVLEQLLRVFDRLAQLPAGKLLVNAVIESLKPRAIPGVAQRCGRGVAHLPDARQQRRPAQASKKTVERSGHANRRLRIPR